MSESWGVGYMACGARGATGRNLSAGERESVMYRLRESFEREERPMSNALETLAMVIQGADEYTERVGDGSWSERIAAAVVAFLTSDEAVDRAARSAHENPHPWQVASGDWGAAGHEIREAFIAQQRAAILAVLGVESLPLDPEPWECHMKRPGELRHSLWDARMCSIPYFAPRPGYEQRREFYEKGADHG